MTEHGGGALADVPAPGEWVAQGACRGMGNAGETFFPTRGEEAATAKAICRTCPVIAQCRAYALAWPKLIGIWGGLSDRERRRIRAKRPIPPGPVVSRLLELAARPGQRELVRHYPSPTGANSMAGQFRSGRRRHPPGRWRFESSVTSCTTGSDLFATYLGPDEDEAAAG